MSRLPVSGPSRAFGVVALLMLVTAAETGGCSSAERAPRAGAGGTSGGTGPGAAGTLGIAGTGPAGTSGPDTGGAGTSAPDTGVAGTSAAGTGAAGTSAAGTMGAAGTGAAGTAAAGVGAAGMGAAGMASDGGTDVAAPPLPAPMTPWMEHWFEHVQSLKLVSYNDDVALYVDNDVPAGTADWLNPFLTKVWRYTRQTYGELKSATSDGRLYQIAHTNKYSGGHASTFLDASHDFRNVSDIGPGPWTAMDLDLPTHQVARVVEASFGGVSGSPQLVLWGDSKWAEFFTYDVFTSLGMTSDATRVNTAFTNRVDTYPQANTHWFRDWFFPLWRDHGHAQVMVRYFKLVAQYFPRTGNAYARNMTMAEFVHFMSGAANANLRAMASTAFGATHPTDAEFAAARAAFPMITYP